MALLINKIFGKSFYLISFCIYKYNFPISNKFLLHTFVLFEITIYALMAFIQVLLKAKRRTELKYSESSKCAHHRASNQKLNLFHYFRGNKVGYNALSGFKFRAQHPTSFLSCTVKTSMRKLRQLSQSIYNLFQLCSVSPIMLYQDHND